MAYVLPETVLELQVCTSCKKYLSYPPTKIYANGKIKCGRCSTPDDGGTVSTMFETLAKNMLFPCTNRFEGCSSMLQYTDVKQHEENCVGSIVDECLICLNSDSSIFSDSEDSILHLIHHFKTKHPRNILVKPVIECDLKSKVRYQYFLKWDYEENKIFLIQIFWNQQVISLTCYTGKGPQMTQMAVTCSGPDEADKNFLSTDFKECFDIDCDDVDYPTMWHKIQVPVHLTKVTCELIFNFSTPLRKILQLHTKPEEEYKKRVVRKAFLDKDFKKKYNIDDAAAFKLSVSGVKLEFQKCSLHIACDFCQNLFATSGICREVYNMDNDCYICGTCYHRGVQEGLDNTGSPLSMLVDGDHQLFNFYCKHGCGKFVRSGELLWHESQCNFNDKRSLTDEEYVKFVFGNEFVQGQKYSVGNVICDVASFREKGKIFIATRDHFKCIIDYKVDSSSTPSRCHFHINHHYDTRTYNISVNKWEDGRFCEEYNDFSMKVQDCQGPSLFAVVLKEIQEKLKIFEI